MPIVKNLVTGWTGSVTDKMAAYLLKKEDADGKRLFAKAEPPPAAPAVKKPAAKKRTAAKKKTK